MRNFGSKIAKIRKCLTTLNFSWFFYFGADSKDAKTVAILAQVNLKPLRRARLFNLLLLAATGVSRVFAAKNLLFSEFVAREFVALWLLRCLRLGRRVNKWAHSYLMFFPHGWALVREVRRTATGKEKRRLWYQQRVCVSQKSHLDAFMLSSSRPPSLLSIPSGRCSLSSSPSS